MGRKKIISIFAIAFLLICFITETLAANIENVYIGIKHYSTKEDGTNIGYAIGLPEFGGKKINILETHISQEEGSDLTEEQPTIYCLKPGMGFYFASRIAKYDLQYNMINDMGNIAQYSELTYQLTESENYKKLVTLLSLIYVPGRSTEDYKNDLLNKAMQKYNVQYTTKITDEDIAAVNQVLIWYYTEPDNEMFDKYNEENWLAYTTDGEEYELLSEYDAGNREGEDREKQVEALYKYLIDEVEKATTSGKKVNEDCKVISEIEETIPLREEPGKSSNVLKDLNKEDKVNRFIKNVGYIDGCTWDKVRTEDGIEGYIESDNLQIESENITCQVLTGTGIGNVNLRERPTSSSGAICSVASGTIVTRLESRVAKANSYIWDKIKLSDGRTGYIARQYLVEIDEEEANRAEINGVRGLIEESGEVNEEEPPASSEISEVEDMNKMIESQALTMEITTDKYKSEALSPEEIELYDGEYYIKVNYEANVVTVYQKDEQGDYTIPIKAMICSTGELTPEDGVYETSDQYEWRNLNRKCMWTICNSNCTRNIIPFSPIFKTR